MRDALTAIGVGPAAIHTELFAALPPVRPGVTSKAGSAPHQPPGRPGSGPLITFARSGITTPFGDDWHSVLDLADACDVPTRWSCRTGVCHTCVTALLSGDISYAPDPLELPADGQVLICCARPATDIVLDM
jgi:ferredoxin